VILGLNFYNTHTSFLLTSLPTRSVETTPLYLPVYFLDEIIFIEITAPGRKEKGTKVFFVYFVTPLKKESS
jgi:hypothetical protein